MIGRLNKGLFFPKTEQSMTYSSLGELTSNT